MIRKRGKKWCVLSSDNPDWSGGCYDTRAQAEQRLAQVERAKWARRRGLLGPYRGPVKDYLKRVRAMRRFDAEADEAIASGNRQRARELTDMSWGERERAQQIYQTMSRQDRERARAKIERAPEGSISPYGKMRRRLATRRG